MMALGKGGEGTTPVAALGPVDQRNFACRGSSDDKR